jgi:hypothetical protein
MYTFQIFFSHSASDDCFLCCEKAFEFVTSFAYFSFDSYAFEALSKNSCLLQCTELFPLCFPVEIFTL